MRRAWPWHAVRWGLLLGLAGAAHAVEPAAGSASAAATAAATAAAQRQQIKTDRAAVDARYKQAEADCSQRFAVSGCIADAQAQRREAMTGLRQRELVLDEAQRQADADESARRVQAKQAEAASKPAPVPRAASAPASAAASAAAGPAPGERARQRSKTADEAAAATTRVAAQQRRASEAAAHRQDVEQRNAERNARGKKVSPLPVPSAASVAAAGSAPGR
jgi:colicin import membrane protein